MGRVQTTQTTGKGWKGIQALGCLGCLIGITLFIAAIAMTEQAARRAGPSVAAAWGVGLLMIGLPVYIFGRVGAWWHHG